MKQKHFIDIKHAILEPTELLKDNTLGFRQGDKIVIQEKIDGANACVRYDEENGRLACFSRNRELSADNTLRGFWNIVQKLDVKPFKEHPSWYVFGEMLVPHTIKYFHERYNKWYVYDIYDIEKEKWLPQEIVADFCKRAGLEYVHTYYEGEFISWEHIKSFLHNPLYGNEQEGVAIKNQTTMNNPRGKYPAYLKLVNARFREIQKSNHVQKIKDPQKLEEKERAQNIADMIVTKPRVEKMLHKLVDEDVLPSTITPKDMGLIARELPKRIYADCIKEHNGLVIEAGEYFGKACSSKVMRFVREIVFGK